MTGKNRPAGPPRKKSGLPIAQPRPPRLPPGVSSHIDAHPHASALPEAPMFHARPLAAALAVALLSGACAMDRSATTATAAPDTAPGATLLEGLGSHSFPVT